MVLSAIWGLYIILEYSERLENMPLAFTIEYGLIGLFFISIASLTMLFLVFRRTAKKDQTGSFWPFLRIMRVLFFAYFIISIVGIITSFASLLVPS